MKKTMTKIFKIVFNFKVLAILSVVSIAAIPLSNYYIQSFASEYLYDDVNSVPHNQVGVILGTSKYTRTGNINFYYSQRIEACSKLYHSGKIKCVIVSGDNGTSQYNEPKMMEEDLINKGIPKENIHLDYAGFRTFDSMIRAKKIFGQDKFTIISQKFHNERAVFLARKNEIDAIAFNAGNGYITKKVRVREYFAKFKAVLDQYILFTQPKFLGEKIIICN